MKAFTTLYDEVVPEVPGAELALVLYHIKQACREFCQRSLYAREVLAPIDVVASTATYTATPSAPSDFEVGSVVEARILVDSALRQLSPRAPRQLDAEVPNWDTQTGQPIYYTQRATNTVTLAPIPAASITAGLVLTIAKVPLAAGGGIDDDLYAKFLTGLAAGAKYRLMRMGKKPWSDANMAGYYERVFNTEIAAAAMLASKAFGRGPSRTKAYA